MATIAKILLVLPALAAGLEIKQARATAASAHRKLQNTVSYDYYIDLIYQKTDQSSTGNNDNEIQSAEFQRLLVVLDLDCNANRDPSDYCISNWNAEFTQADADGDGGIDRAELISYVEAKVGSGASQADIEMGNAMIMALTGVPDPDTFVSAIGEVSDTVANADALVEVGFALAQEPDTIFPGERSALKRVVRELLEPTGPPFVHLANLDDMTMTVLAGSSVVTITAFFPDETAANAGSANLAATIGTTADANAAFASVGVTVTAAPTVSVRRPLGSKELDTGGAVTFAVVTVVLFLASCALAMHFGKKKRRATPGAPERVKCGLCKCRDGCCSAYSLVGWASADVLAVLFLLIGAFMLFVAVGDTVDAISCIIDNIFDLRDAASADAREAVASLDSTLDLIDPMRPHIDLMSFAVIGPACLAAVTILISVFCIARKSKTTCCMKIFLVLSWLILLEAIVFYAVLAALGPVVQQPFADEMLSTITGLCETTQPVLAQTFQDTTTALARASASGGVDPADIAELQQQLADAEEPLAIFGSLCGCVTTLFDSFVDLFVPAVMCVLACIFALYSSVMTCCAAKCCSSPKVGDAAMNGVASSSSTKGAVSV